MAERSESPRDPLLREEAPGHAVELPVLGVPVRFTSTEPALLDHARAVFGGWAVLADHPELVEEEGPEVRLVLEEPHPGDDGRPAVRYRLPDDDLLLVATPGSTAVADRRRARATAFLTPTLLGEAEHARLGVLSALTLFLVTARDRRPVHAAAVGRGGRVLLLHGPSGVGKSTLALAAVRSGFHLLAEDVVYAQLDPTFRVWGHPGRVHVPPDSLRFFPGLEDPGRRVLAGGREKIPLEVASPPGPPVASRAGICLLRGSRGEPRAERVGRAEVAEAVAHPDEPGFDLFRGLMDPVLEPLLAGGAWRVEMGDDPARAAGLLGELLGEGAGGS